MNTSRQGRPFFDGFIRDMNIWGKLIGFAVGLLLFHNPFGAIACMALGHIWDSGFGRLRGPMDSAPLSFVAPLFGLAGAIAKSDGRVSEQEIQATEQLMARMQLSSDLRSAAIAQFNAGKQPGFSTTNAITHLRAWCAGRRDRAFLLVDLLLDIVCAEGPLAPGKLAIVRKLCWSLGMDERQLAAVAAMKGYAYVAPDNWDDYSRAHGSRDARAPSTTTKDPYAILGIDRNMGDNEIKRAYRKLMSQNHPDKLGNVPEALKRRAEERSREINAAYENICEARGIK